MAQFYKEFYPVGMDFDTILELVGQPAMGSFEGAYISARNGHLYPGKYGGGNMYRKMGGTEEIFWDNPRTGSEEGMGAFWDEKHNTLIAFVHNSNGQDSIIWHKPDTAFTGTVRIPGGVNGKVTGAVLINGELLAWTDRTDYPKMIDLPRADDTQKIFKLRVFLPQSDVLVDFRQFSVQTVLNGIPQGASTALANATTRQVRDFRPMVSHFASEWNGILSLSSAFTATAKGEWIELEATAAGDWSATVTITDYINGVAQAPVQCVVEKLNAYNGAWHFAQMRLSREKPITPPTITMGTDETRKSNLLRNKMFQFCYGFRLRNKERTLTSPFSILAVPSSGPCTAGSPPNYADVGLQDDKWLNDPAIRGEIETIDIYARDGNLGAWMLVDSLEKWQWMYRRSYRFYNDNVSSPADPSFIEQSMTYVPPIANALEVFRDVDDNQRIVMGGVREGDETPSLDITFDVELSNSVASQATASVIADIWIRGFGDLFQGNPWGSPYTLNQAVQVYDNSVGPTFGGMSLASVGHTGNPEAWGQNLPLGGFLIYAKGTDKYGISTQVVPVASYSCGTNSPILWQVPQGHAATGRNVYDALQTGFSLNNCNKSGRSAIRQAIENNSVKSQVRIDGLVPGETYVLCLADFGTTLEDLNSPALEWQRKSGLPLKMGSINTVNIESGDFQCTVTIPLGAGGTVISIGEIEIADRTNPGLLDGSLVVDGTVFDALGIDYSPATDIRVTGVSAERQSVVFKRYVAGAFSGGFPPQATTPWQWVNRMFSDGIVPTDHNGYFCFFQQSIVGSVPRAAVLGVTGDPGNPAGTITGFTGSSVLVSHYQVMNDIGASKWEGEITGPLVAAGPNLNGTQWKRYMFPNLNQSVSLRTHIRARVVDIGGAPLQGIGAILEGGRYTETDASGIINLIAMGDAYTNNNDRVTDRLIWYATGPCNVEMPSGGKIVNVFITQFSAGNPFSETPASPPWPNWLNMPDKVAVVTSLGGISCFSRGGTYSVAGAFGRWDGSGTALKEFATLRIPNLGENLTLFDPLQWPPASFPGGLWSSGVASIRWTIAGPVEIPWIGRWEYFQLYVTKDLSRDFQLQWVAGEVTYSSVWDELGTAPTPTTYSSGNATEIYIVLTDSLVRYQELNTSSTLGYAWQSGDMLRIISDANGGQVFSVMEYEISGQRNPSGQVGKWIVLKADSSMPQIVAGMRMEIFRPALAGDNPEEKVFYAVPGGLVPVDDPYGATPAWSALTGVLDRGDTWLIPTKVPFGTGTPVQWSSRSMTRESKSFSDLFESNSWDRGKVLFTDPDAKVQSRGLLMRYSDSFLPGTSVNGLNFFGGFNVKATEGWMGEIQAILEVQESFVVPCTNGTFAIYKGVQQLRETAESLTQVSGGVLANIRPMAHHYGTVDPQSVRRTATTILAFDRRKGVLWQWGSNQLNPVSKQRKANTYFMRKAAGMPTDRLCTSGWDMVNGEVLFSFPSVTYTQIGDDGLPLSVIDPAETMQYHDEANHFVFLMDWSPDFWGHTSLALYSFKDGRLWKHEAKFDSASLNVIAGNQLDLEAEIPLNGGPMEVADIRTVWLARGPGWSIPEITNNMGQASYCPEDKITSTEGRIYKADLLPDTSSGHEGAVLKATAYRFKLLHPGPTPCTLYSIRFGETPSADSGMNAAGQ